MKIPLMRKMLPAVLRRMRILIPRMRRRTKSRRVILTPNRMTLRMILRTILRVRDLVLRMMIPTTQILRLKVRPTVTMMLILKSPREIPPMTTCAVE
jgi:hypothetical protein